MTHWEYRHIDLHRGGGKTGVAACSEVAAELAKAGEEGWEAIGEIGISYVQPGHVFNAVTVTRVLTLKRPVT